MHALGPPNTISYAAANRVPALGEVLCLKRCNRCTKEADLGDALATACAITNRFSNVETKCTDQGDSGSSPAVPMLRRSMVVEPGFGNRSSHSIRTHAIIRFDVIIDEW